MAVGLFLHVDHSVMCSLVVACLFVNPLNDDTPRSSVAPLRTSYTHYTDCYVTLPVMHYAREYSIRPSVPYALVSHDLQTGATPVGWPLLKHGGGLPHPSSQMNAHVGLWGPPVGADKGYIRF